MRRQTGSSSESTDLLGSVWQSMSQMAQETERFSRSLFHVEDTTITDGDMIKSQGSDLSSIWTLEATSDMEQNAATVHPPGSLKNRLMETPDFVNPEGRKAVEALPNLENTAPEEDASATSAVASPMPEKVTSTQTPSISSPHLESATSTDPSLDANSEVSDTAFADDAKQSIPEANDMASAVGNELENYNKSLPNSTSGDSVKPDEQPTVLYAVVSGESEGSASRPGTSQEEDPCTKQQPHNTATVSSSIASSVGSHAYEVRLPVVATSLSGYGEERFQKCDETLSTITATYNYRSSEESSESDTVLYNFQATENKGTEPSQSSQGDEPSEISQGDERTKRRGKSAKSKNSTRPESISAVKPKGTTLFGRRFSLSGLQKLLSTPQPSQTNSQDNVESDRRDRRQQGLDTRSEPRNSRPSSTRKPKATTLFGKKRSRNGPRRQNGRGPRNRSGDSNNGVSLPREQVGQANKDGLNVRAKQADSPQRGHLKADAHEAASKRRRNPLGKLFSRKGEKDATPSSQEGSSLMPNVGSEDEWGSSKHELSWASRGQSASLSGSEGASQVSKSKWRGVPSTELFSPLSQELEETSLGKRSYVSTGVRSMQEMQLIREERTDSRVAEDREPDAERRGSESEEEPETCPEEGSYREESVCADSLLGTESMEDRVSVQEENMMGLQTVAILGSRSGLMFSESQVAGTGSDELDREDVRGGQEHFAEDASVESVLRFHSIAVVGNTSGVEFS